MRLPLILDQKVRVDYRLLVSDHYSLVLTLNMAWIQVNSIAWPQIPKTLPQKLHDLPCVSHPLSYSEWQDEAVEWLSYVCEQRIPAQGVLRPVNKSCLPRTQLYFRRLLRIAGLLSELVNHKVTDLAQNALQRKVAALKWRPWLRLLGSHEQLLHQVRDELQRHIDHHQQKALRDWQDLARGWSVSDAKVFAYLRNPPPMKPLSFEVDATIRTDPLRIQDSLFAFRGNP